MAATQNEKCFVRKQGKTNYDYKQKKHVPIKLKQGFIAAAVRNFYTDLSKVKHDDPNFEKALKFAKRCHEKYLLSDFLEEEEPSKKKLGESGGRRKAKILEVRGAMLQWFIDVRESLRERLPMKIFRYKCVQVFDEWLKEQSNHISEKDQLKFSKLWIQDWMKEYNVSLRKPDKRYALKKEDRVVRVQDYLKNIWMARKYFLETYGIDLPIVKGDQIPFHRNENASQKTLSLKSETVFVKENYMFSRERVTCFNWLCSDSEVTLLPACF